MKVKISREAVGDLENIWRFTSLNWSRRQADNYYKELSRGIMFLSGNPFSGQDCSYIKTDYRFIKVKSHLIFYRVLVDANTVEVIRVLHHRMNIRERLLD